MLRSSVVAVSRCCWRHALVGRQSYRCPHVTTRASASKRASRLPTTSQLHKIAAPQPRCFLRFMSSVVIVIVSSVVMLVESSVFTLEILRNAELFPYVRHFFFVVRCPVEDALPFDLASRELVGFFRFLSRVLRRVRSLRFFLWRELNSTVRLFSSEHRCGRD